MKNKTKFYRVKPPVCRQEILWNLRTKLSVVPPMMMILVLTGILCKPQAFVSVRTHKPNAQNMRVKPVQVSERMQMHATVD